MPDYVTVLFFSLICNDKEETCLSMWKISTERQV